jgi:phenylacetate-coenzyme A ligase PaaK-like adenylate-forming protein
MEIQNRLLMEQLDLVRKSEIGHKFLGNNGLASVKEFREVVPITTYEDYEPYFEVQNESVLPYPAYIWARTSGRSGRLKWIPYTKQAYNRLGERVFAGVILAAARGKGDINIEEKDVLVYNTPPRPYVSGVALRALAEQFDFRFIPPLDETETLEFQERIEIGFQTALRTGIDILGSLSVVLVKMGERFAEGASASKLSLDLLHPKVAFRLSRAYLQSKIEKRSMLPKDLWKVKAIPSGGMDTSIYKDKIKHYWGISPFEQYGSTEEGAMATQVWNKEGMTFFPDAAFYEFIPESEWSKWRHNASYQPNTVLIDQLEPNQRYEVVITNFYGKPLIRYRMHDLIEIKALRDPETGIQLPQMVFVGRSEDFIDLAGFTGLIDEKQVWQAILRTGIQYEEWTIRKEVLNSNPILHLYIETEEDVGERTIKNVVHESLKALNPSYRDYELMIQEQALEVTKLKPGTFNLFMMEQHAAGADLAHLKPPHMNARDEIINRLKKLSAEGA